MPLLDQDALSLLKDVAQNGVLQTASRDLTPAEAALGRAGLIRSVRVDHEAPALVLTGRGVRASGQVAWNTRRELWH